MLIVGALSGVYFTVGAQVYVAEALLAVVALFSTLHRDVARIRPAIFVGILLWALGTILSDLAAGSGSNDALRGAVRVLILGINLIAICALANNRVDRMLYFWAGAVVSALLSFGLYPTAYARSEPWKFGLSIPVTLGVALLVTRFVRWRWAQIAAFLALAATNFVFGTRSLAVVCAAAALLLLLSSRRLRRDTSWPRLLAISILVVVGAAFLTSAYDDLAESGQLGSTAQAKSSMQSDGIYGSLLTGRIGAVVATQSILEDPLLGVGSYGTASVEVQSRLASQYADLGYGASVEGLVDGERDFHSQLLGMIGENGLLAAPFWVAVAVLLVRGAARVVTVPHRFTPFVSLLIALGGWDLLFSPFGADKRLWLAATVVTVQCFLTNADFQVSRGGNAKN